ncbi:hypothetical protein PUN28_017318 [Cardiocondyla obscurior]|uniref:Uncharacterized protein n=1 Tax=Cardiocondyla obscurior TaxID=286306 RepID=A0AAW2EQK9_9HYME
MCARARAHAGVHAHAGAVTAREEESEEEQEQEQEEEEWRHDAAVSGYESHERLSHCKHACNRDSSRLTCGPRISRRRRRCPSPGTALPGVRRQIKTCQSNANICAT